MTGAVAPARQNLPPLGAHANAGSEGTTDVPAGQNMPAAHCDAADCMRLCEVPPRQNAPAAHTPHALAPAAEKAPAAHAWQFDAALATVDALNVPAAHATCCADVEPAGQ